MEKAAMEKTVQRTITTTEDGEKIEGVAVSAEMMQGVMRKMFWGGFRAGLWLALAVLIIFALGVAVARAQDAAVGDSIAVGVGPALGVRTFARQGAGSCEIARYAALGRPWTHLVISAGINDGGGCVGALRARVKSAHVTWIVPAPINPGAAAVLAVASRFGDSYVRYACKGGCTRRNFHPGSYAALAREVRRGWDEHR